MRQIRQSSLQSLLRAICFGVVAACCLVLAADLSVAQSGLGGGTETTPAQTPMPQQGIDLDDQGISPGDDALAPTPSAAKTTTEGVEADVSTRSVAVTSGFTGSEIIVFGTVIDSEQEAAEAGLYDVIITLDGTGQPIVARKKSWVAGIWINTQSVTFDALPSYYAISSTRPINEIAPVDVLRAKNIGFAHLFADQADGATGASVLDGGSNDLVDAEADGFKASVIRLKTAQNLYQRKPYGVAFIGKSLFRSSIKLPANVPVGALKAQVYLFRDGKLLSEYTASVSLQREGLERWLHDLAFNQPLLYGLLAVALAVFAGLAASTMFPRRAG